MDFIDDDEFFVEDELFVDELFIDEFFMDDELFIELCMPDIAGAGVVSASAVPAVAAARAIIRDKDVKRIGSLSLLIKLGRLEVITPHPRSSDESR